MVAAVPKDMIYTPFRKCQKRVRRAESWKRNVAKVKRAKGEEYISPSTGVVPSRKTRPSCRKCHRCFDQFSEEERSGIIKTFKIPIYLAL